MSDLTRTITYTVLAKSEDGLSTIELAEHVGHYDITTGTAGRAIEAMIHADLDTLIAKAHKTIALN